MSTKHAPQSSPTDKPRKAPAGLHEPAPTRPSPAPPAIEIHDLCKSFGPVRAVDGLSLTVPRGQILAFLGPNGAGKSTTLDMVLGFSQPDSGSLRVLGSSPAEVVSTGRVGAVLQNGGLVPGYTVGQTLEVVASLQATAPDIDDVVAQTRLGDLLRRRVSKLSGGEKQRLRLALALLPDPDLLVLDEPTTGLDVTARAAFWETMRLQGAKHQRTVVFATHYLQEAADFADRIIIIDRGRLSANGTVDQVQALGTGTSVTATWPGLTGEAELRHALAGLESGLLSVTVHGEHLELLTTGPDDVARRLLTTTPASHLGISAPSLDDVFSALVASPQEAVAA